MSLPDYLASLTANFLKQIGMEVAIYRLNEVAAPDGNTVPDAVTRTGNSTAAFQFGREAQNQALAMGVLGVTTAIAKMPSRSQKGVLWTSVEVDTETLVGLQTILVDAKNRAWLVRAPAIVGEVQSTFSLAFLVSEISSGNLPDGITL